MCVCPQRITNRITTATSKQVKVENSVLFSLIRNLNLPKKKKRRQKGESSRTPSTHRDPQEPPGPPPRAQHQELKGTLASHLSPAHRRTWGLTPGVRYTPTHPVPGTLGDPDSFTLKFPKFKHKPIAACRHPTRMFTSYT